MAGLNTARCFAGSNMKVFGGTEVED